MRVKHKNTEKHRQDPYTPLEHWHKLYLPNNKYLNYEFYDVDKIVDIYEIEEETGNTVFLKSEFVNYADIIVKESPKKYFYQPLAENRLDRNLMPKKTDYSGLSFLKRLLIRIKQVITPKKNPNKIPFSRIELMQMKIGVWAIAIPIVVTIILFIIDKMYFIKVS